ncbi:LemA protein [Gammaproteobacteria bacterium]
MVDKAHKTGDLDDLGETPNSERLQRMREIMRQINRDEVPVEDLKIPPIKSKLFILGISLASVLLLVSTVLYKYNWFVSAEEDVRSAKGTIENALQLRSNLFANLVNLTLNQAAMEQETMRYVAEIRARQSPPQARGSEKIPAVTNPVPAMPGLGGESLPDVLARLFAVVEQYPDIKTSATYKQLMDKLMELENRIHQRRDEYNEKVRIYNAMTITFPWRFVAYLGGFTRYHYFESDPHRPDTVEINIGSGTFRRLIPVPTPSYSEKVGFTKSEKDAPVGAEVKSDQPVPAGAEVKP